MNLKDKDVKYFDLIPIINMHKRNRFTVTNKQNRPLQ